MNALIIHGTYGNPNSNWFPWLKAELEKLDFEVYVPEFPTPENQNLENWFKVFEEYEKYIDENSIIIGHSLGSAFILNILEKIKQKIKAAFLVAGFIGLLNNPNFDELNRTFIEKKFDWNKIKQNCKQFFIYNSDDDPYIPLEKGKKLAENLDSELILVKSAKHFNTEAGYNEFPILLKDIKNLIKK